jgi:two-component system phosphate regulon response regulator PhoB/two-component system alkaline phosphatase synthesis response regulator PhoP
VFLEHGDAMNELIAVVDDEPDITELVSLHLIRSGFRVRTFRTGKELLEFFTRQLPDLLVLDLMLPDIDGLDLCRTIRGSDRLASIPVIMLTARAEETDRVLGLELGADDYVVKPFSPKELVARVKAVLRRGSRREVDRSVSVDDLLHLDLRRHQATVDGHPVELTATEFRILHLLASRVGWVYSREAILRHLWGNEKYVLDRTVDVHIRHLRAKLGARGSIIRNVRGIGYKLEP